MENYKDRLPRHERENSREAIENSEGMWKSYTRTKFWDKMGRRSDKDVYEAEVVTQILQNMELEYTTENDMVKSYIGHRNFLSLKLSLLSYPSVLTYVLCAQKNRLDETVLLSTHNICFG